MFLGMFVLLAFLAQSIIPTGYMPKFGTGKFFEIVICHGAEQVSLLVDEHMQPVKVADHKNNQNNSADDTKPCVFASASGSSLEAQNFLHQQTEYLIYEQFVVREVRQPTQNISAKSYLAQAPPVTHPIV